MVGTPARTESGAPVRSSPPPSGCSSGASTSLWPIVVVVGLANAGALALQRLVLHNRPTEDITDVNGLADTPLALLAALLVAFALAPLVAIAQSATSRVVEGIAHGHRISGWSAIVLAVRRPAGAVVQLVLFMVVTVLASSLFGASAGPAADRVLRGRDAGRGDRGPWRRGRPIDEVLG